jgi:hypothetical protein
MMQIDNALQSPGPSGGRAREWIEVGIRDFEAGPRPDADAAPASDDLPLPLSPPQPPWPRIFPGL